MVGGIALIGLVYNLGAVCAFISLADLTASLGENVSSLDRQLGLNVAGTRSERSNQWATWAVNLTKMFFLVWIVLWLGLVLWTIWHERRLFR
jgi:hypothetical protein